LSYLKKTGTLELSLKIKYLSTKKWEPKRELEYFTYGTGTEEGVS
jgi:hypothetical protein